MTTEDNVLDRYAAGEVAHPRAWESRHLYCYNLPCEPVPAIGTVLVTGATGYVGGRLVPELLARGYRVRVMVRSASPEYTQQWPGAEVVVADALDKGSLRAALGGVSLAYYLIHSMLLGRKEFASADIQAAANFRTAAGEAGVKRIVYLGGLGDIRSGLSDHLRSRMEVAGELRRGDVPVTILRAAVIIGSGSASYELIKNIVLKVPVIVVPPFARTRCQPISIRDVVKYLVGVLEIPETAGGTYDIGGTDILTYEKMAKIVAEVLQKKRLFVPVPFTNVRLYSYIVSLITPVPGPITRSLMESLRNEVVVQDTVIRSLIPFAPVRYKVAIVRALTREEKDRVHTRWSDAYPPAHELALKLHQLREHPTYTATFSFMTDKESAALFKSICRIGGKKGWFRGNWMWRLRGLLDRVLLGVGTSRGRKQLAELRINDVVDFWRVEDMRPNERLLLRAEMKLPGKAWLEFTIKDEGSWRMLTVTPYYHTKSIIGKLYWYIFLPFHNFIFTSLIRQIEARS